MLKKESRRYGFIEMKDTPPSPYNCEGKKRERLKKSSDDPRKKEGKEPRCCEYGSEERRLSAAPQRKEVGRSNFTKKKGKERGGGEVPKRLWGERKIGFLSEVREGKRARRERAHACRGKSQLLAGGKGEESKRPPSFGRK